MSCKPYFLRKQVAVAAALALAAGVSSTSFGDNRYPENGDLWPLADVGNVVPGQTKAQPSQLLPDGSGGCAQEQKSEPKSSGANAKPLVSTASYFDVPPPYFNQYPGQ